MHPLTNFDIEKLLGDYKEFGGVFSKDLVNPTNCKDGELYILNLDKVGNEGSHWTLLSTVDKDYNMYYDSFSVFAPESVVSFLKKQKKNTLCNPPYENEQDISTVSCGYFCVFIALLQLKMKYNVRECLDFFKDDNVWNEEVMQMFSKEVERKLRDS
jgi:hypothetical protein